MHAFVHVSARACVCARVSVSWMCGCFHACGYLRARVSLCVNVLWSCVHLACAHARITSSIIFTCTCIVLTCMCWCDGQCVCTCAVNSNTFQLLENAGDPRRGVLILVSDGMENQNPPMADVKDTLLEKGVILHVILISECADKDMIKLSAAVGGKAFFDAGTTDTTDIQSALRTIASDDDVSSPGAAPVQVDAPTFKCNHINYDLVILDKILLKQFNLFEINQY